VSCRLQHYAALGLDSIGGEQVFFLIAVCTPFFINLLSVRSWLHLRAADQSKLSKLQNEPAKISRDTKHVLSPNKNIKKTFCHKNTSLIDADASEKFVSKSHSLVVFSDIIFETLLLQTQIRFRPPL
jgi:hypothetical protein